MGNTRRLRTPSNAPHIAHERLVKWKKVCVFFDRTNSRLTSLRQFSIIFDALYLIRTARFSASK